MVNYRVACKCYGLKEKDRFFAICGISERRKERLVSPSRNCRLKKANVLLNYTIMKMRRIDECMGYRTVVLLGIWTVMNGKY